MIMSRQAREISRTGLYHIIFRGINRQNIFEDERDYEKFLEIIRETKEKIEFKIYAYCLMSNHAHIFVGEESIGDISTIMQRILTKYAGWYNKKYQRSGSLFGNRFKSQSVERDSHLLSLVRYIHQNPLKAGIVDELSQYEWSSYNQYIGKCNGNIIDTNYILEMLSENREIAKDTFVEFHKENEIEVFEIGDSRKKTNEEIRRIIIKMLNGEEPHIIGTMPKNKRNEIIKKLIEQEGFSIREIERATGISRGVISRIK